MGGWDVFFKKITGYEWPENFQVVNGVNSKTM